LKPGDHFSGAKVENRRRGIQAAGAAFKLWVYGLGFRVEGLGFRVNSYSPTEPE
jgi:hypothetical protein